MKNRTFSVIFYGKTSKEKVGRIPLYARITVDGERTEISVKRDIEKQNWNPEKGMPKGSKEEVKSLQAYLEQYRSLIVSNYQQLVIEKKSITSEILKNKILGKEEVGPTLCSLVEYHNKTMVSTLSQGTLKNYFTTQRYIHKFLTENRKRKDIDLNELDYKFISEFEIFLRNHQPLNHQRPMANNGVMKHLERIRKMVNLAIRLEWLSKDPFINHKLKSLKVDKEFLSEEELHSIQDKQFTIARLANVRDMFVFSCYTGLAYIDLMNLKPQNIIAGIDKTLWIKTKRQKTEIDVKVPLLPQALVILDRYKNNPKAIHEGKIFPIISNQRMNSYLKEIAVICGITKELTFHCARHTFGTTITLTNGVPIESVSKMMGHTKLSTTQGYARVLEKKISDDMNNLRTKLLGK